MTGGSSINSPCGACKFLRRKCIKGCIFAPYFSHEQGAHHFAAIHKVFGASNASKLLSQIPVSDRCEAAVTMSYEAQARLQDPIYGCVSHIFALQHQVMNLQAQLALLKEQANRSIINSTTNPNHGSSYFPSVDSQSWLHSIQNQGKTAQFDQNFGNYNSPEYEINNGFTEENTSFGSMDSFETQSNEHQWSFQDEANELRLAALRYQHS